MKYQEGLKETKDFLKTTPEPQMRELCNKAGLTEKETEMIVQKFRKGKSRLHSSYDLGMSESREHPKGERWNKETTLKVFSDAGHPLSNERYSENGVYWAMNMVYSDFFPMYKDDVSKYVEHAYLFLNDKDFKCKYSKEKWYAKKRA